MEFNKTEYENNPSPLERPAIEEFLLDRVKDYERQSHYLPRDMAAPMMALCTQIRLVIDWHAKWPIIVEGSIEIKESLTHHIDAISYQARQQIDFVTQEEFRRRFGKLPPTAPLLRKMARVYKDHPDYNPEWSD